MNPQAWITLGVGVGSLIAMAIAAFMIVRVSTATMEARFAAFEVLMSERSASTLLLVDEKFKTAAVLRGEDSIDLARLREASQLYSTELQIHKYRLEDHDKALGEHRERLAVVERRP